MTTGAATVVSAPVEAPAQTNPLLVGGSFPLWDKVKPEHVVPGMRQLLQELGEEITALESGVTPTWSGLVQPLERISDRFQTAWGIVSHLKHVKDSKDLREAVEEVQPETVALGLRLGQSKPLYEAYRALKAGPEWEGLTSTQKRVVELELRDFVFGGVALEGKEKERFNEIQQALAQLSTKFTENVLDSTKAFKKLITDKAVVDGLPESALGLLAQQAERSGSKGATAEEGPWLVTLDIPSYMPIMMHAKDRALREELYKSYVTRASTGEGDNAQLIDKILLLKSEKAKLLGFSTFAELSLASKMATVETAQKLMADLAGHSKAGARQDLAEVQEFAASKGFEGELLWWDFPFWAERLRESKYSITDEELRPYFALPNVLKGMFALAKRLFNVDVVAADGQVPVWHPDVRFFQVNMDGKPKAYFYFDPYSRPAEKKDGAWMSEVVGQSTLFAPDGEHVRLPVGNMVCNFPTPLGDKPSLITFNDVETMFHEFGHELQHILTLVEEGMVSGIRGVEWDAVELPSQFMENWAYDKRTLYSFAKHYASGIPLPEELYDRLKAAKNFRSATQMLRQVHFATLDLDLHSGFLPGQGKTIFDVEKEAAAKVLVYPPYPGDRFLCAFSHIFAGGYAAGYYSYKWAEVLSADAFGAFEEAGLDDDAAVEATGRRFRSTVLALGGSKAPADVFVDFRGRGPTTDALLRHSGLLPAEAAGPEVVVAA